MGGRTKYLLFLISTTFLFSNVFAEDVFVRGYYRRDGTYVRPHYRSKPDGVKYNNYGRASYRQRKQYRNYPIIPSYNNDYDNDGVPNRYDYDDDNDGIFDDYDSNQYGKNRGSYSFYFFRYNPKPSKKSYLNNYKQNKYYRR